MRLTIVHVREKPSAIIGGRTDQIPLARQAFIERIARADRMGLFWGLLSPLGYAATYLCLRVAALQVDPLVAAFFRSVPLVVAAWTILLTQWRASGKSTLVWPGRRPLCTLIVIGLMFNLSGNAGFQVALGMAGLAVSAPITGGAMLWGSALTGWWLLREWIAPTQTVGLLVLMIALPFLTGADGSGTELIWLGGLAAAIAGLSFGSGNAMVRHTVLRYGTSPGMILVPITTTGMLALLSLILIRQGLVAFQELDAVAIGWLVLAGCFNVVGLVAVTRALELLPAAQVGALSVLQTALASAGGIVIFSEPLNAAVSIGLLLSLVGAMLSQRRPSIRPRQAGSARSLEP
jgi:drug/metabolite transporter (DMT)-like permease